MKIVFFGTSKLAVPSLEALTRKHQISLVITQPDRKKGRDLKVSAPPIKITAQGLGLEIIQPEDVRDKEFINYLKNNPADLFVVISYGKILPKEILNIPGIYAINLHFSLLPAYRGAAPVNWAIYNGDNQTGISIIKMNEKMDAGEIIAQEKTKISANENAEELGERLAEIGSQTLIDTIQLIEKGKAKLVEQPEAKVTSAPKLKKEDGELNFKRSPEDVINQVRAFAPWPGTFTYYKGKLIKVHKAVSDTKGTPLAKPGEVVSVDEKEGIVVACQIGSIKLIELQPEGKRRMSAGEFIRGFRIKPTEKLGK